MLKEINFKDEPSKAVTGTTLVTDKHILKKDLI